MDSLTNIVILTTLAVMFYGSMFSGVFSNHNDLAPNFAGTLMAVTNMVATIPGKNLVNLNGGGFDCARTLQTAILVIPNGQLTDESIKETCFCADKHR